ncbi:MAG TPA: hypothetical protein VNK89_01665 [Thermoflexus sp.]|nr:hypothetical protein [Thermoflexus sp.]
MQNGQGRLINLIGYKPVAAPLYCVLTRIRLRHPWALPLMVLAYLHVKRQARLIPYLKRTAFLLQDIHTFFILSIWEGEQGFLDFGTFVTSHIVAANRAFAFTALRAGRPEIWSTQWRIWAVSNNLNWDGFQDWSTLVGGQAEPPMVAVGSQAWEEKRDEPGTSGA